MRVRVGPLPHLREVAAAAARLPAYVVVLADRDDAVVIAASRSAAASGTPRRVAEAAASVGAHIVLGVASSPAGIPGTLACGRRGLGSVRLSRESKNSAAIRPRPATSAAAWAYCRTARSPDPASPPSTPARKREPQTRALWLPRAAADAVPPGSQYIGARTRIGRRHRARCLLPLWNGITTITHLNYHMHRAENISRCRSGMALRPDSWREQLQPSYAGGPVSRGR